MSLLHSPTILPPPRDRITELLRENEILRTEIRELKISLQRDQERGHSVEAGVANIRSALAPLYRALQQIFGDIEAMDIPDSGQESATPRNKAIWDSWKSKLGGKAAEAIDALLLHGEMNVKQLRIHIKCGQEYVYKVRTQLVNAGLVNVRDGKLSLKEL